MLTFESGPRGPLDVDSKVGEHGFSWKGDIIFMSLARSLRLQSLHQELEDEM